MNEPVTVTLTLHFTISTRRLPIYPSATNPRTVSYTYNTDHTLNTKTDAKGQVFSYTYDGYKRLLTVSVGSNLLRTYSYDTNPYDANYSQSSAGRLTAIQYPAINYEVTSQAPGSTTFTDMFSYWPAGNVAGKRLRVTKTAPYPNGQPHTQTAVGDLNLAYAYNYEGKMTRVTYPTDAYGTTPYFNYSFDAMMRPAGMTDQNSASVVSGVTYGPANELKHMTYNGGTETRTYNSMLQLTNITGVRQGVTYQNITYTFPTTGNAGKIMAQNDAISGETVSYQYDSLNRLQLANGSGWTQTYTYDGFGNLTNRAGTGTAQSTTIATPADLTTKRLSGYTYDFNGNQISTGYAYDAENRLVQANAGAVHYGYDGQNKRIWQATFSNCGGDSCMSSDSISLFGIDGKLIGTYIAGANWNNTQTQIQLSFYSTTQRVYFGKKLVATLDWQGIQHGVVQDRLESVGKYYPFGEERNSPPLANDQVKFASYTRDSATGLDYADQRHYANTFGRFMSPDPYDGSISLGDPQSWNRYSYGLSDPINHADPTGLCTIDGVIYPDGKPPCPDITSVTVTGGGSTFWGSPGLGPGPGSDIAGSAGSRARAANQKEYKADLGVQQPDTLRKALMNALRDLQKPECAALYGSPGAPSWATWDPAKVAQDIFGSNNQGAPKYGFLMFSDTLTFGQPAITYGTGIAAAGLGPLGSLLVGGRSLVVISPSFWDKASPFDAEMVILHELGHVFSFGSGFGSGGSDIFPDLVPDVNFNNDMKVINNCITVKATNP